ncbi:hypothetical protein G3M48_001706 [Beauveria asiatica]|uniref:PA14 domain-containing protein n=1 Tax=Beauveria asiatica TaxID=1069075 RepID=A0AAW0S851_9HYPO
MQFLPLFLASASLAAAHQQPNAVTVTKYLPFEQHPCYAYLTLGGEGDFSAAACRPGACCIGVQDVDTKTGHGGKYVGPGGHPLILASHSESSAQGSSGSSVVTKNSLARGGSKPITSGSVVAVLSSHGGLITKPLVEIKTGDWAVAEESYATTAVTVPETPRETVVVTTTVSKVLTYTTTFSGTPIIKSSTSVVINTKTFTAPAAIPTFTTLTTPVMIPATKVITADNSTITSLVTTTSEKTVASVQPVLINSTTTSEETVSIQTIPTNSSTTSKETVIRPILINSTTTSKGTSAVSSLPIFTNSTTASKETVAVSALPILANSTTTSKETVAVSALPILANSTTTSKETVAHLYDSYYNKQLNHYGDNNANYQYLYVSHCNEQLNYGDEDTSDQQLNHNQYLYGSHCNKQPNYGDKDTSNQQLNHYGDDNANEQYLYGNHQNEQLNYRDNDAVTSTSMAAIITNNSTSASLTTITKSIITPSVVVTTNSSTIIEPIASLIPPPPRTTKSRVIPSSCPTPTCSPGIQYALYDNPFRRDLSPTYKSFSPAYFRKTKPVYSTTLQNAIYITDRYRRGKGFNPLFKNAAAGYRGFLFACQDGRYRFNSPYSDDITIMWFGDKAYQNYTRGNADIIQFFYGDNRPKNIYRDLKAGTYYPIRVLWGNTGGASDLSLRIYGPNGEDVSGADQSGEHFLTTEACDGSYPPFPPWGKENRNRHKKGKKEVE